MQTALVASAFAMGLAGGPHCVAMCGAACGGVIRIVRAGPASRASDASEMHRAMLLHAGRIAGYAAAGAVVAAAAGSLAFASEQVAALRPLWTLLHAFVLAWGLTLLATGRQPGWSRRVGGWLAARLHPLAGSPAALLATGMLWVVMPCGLLYSALMLASLGNGPAQGAFAMASFGLGSTASLLLAPWGWQRLRRRLGAISPAWSARVAGALLAGFALQALWIDMEHQVALWCS